MGRPGAVQLNARWSLKPGDVCAWRRASVESLLALFIKIFAAWKGQSEARARIDIARPC